MEEATTAACEVVENEAVELRHFLTYDLCELWSPTHRVLAHVAGANAGGCGGCSGAAPV